METLSHPSPPSGPTLGERVRGLRTARGLTQAELAGDRFTKEYVSQIELGKTRPTLQTLDWLAERLGSIGSSSRRAHRPLSCTAPRAVIAQAEVAIESNGYEEAIALVAGLALPSPELHVRALLAESWARMYLGEVRQALALVEEARDIVAEASLRRRRSGRGALPARLLQVQALVRIHGALAVHARR